MDNPEATENSVCETSQQQPSTIENNCQPLEKVLLNNDHAEPSNFVNQISNSENQIPVDSTDVSSQNSNVTAEPVTIVPTDNSMPPLPPLPKNDNGQLPQPPAAPFPADYNMQNYANYNNYMYNYNNYYGYPYPQYQWDYNSQQYYQPYQNYYNYNFNQANQTQTSKPPPPPPDSVQLPVEEKPVNKTNTTVDDSNRYSPTAETDDDDPMKGLSENYKPDILIEKPTQTTNAAPLETMISELIEEQQNIPENIDNVIQQTIDPSTLPMITPEQQRVPMIAQVQPYNSQVQQLSYQINPQSQMQSIEIVNEVVNQQQTSPAMNGKDDSIEKVSKASTVLGKSQAKKRLMAFSMMKQKLQEQNNSVIDNQSSDIGEGNDVEFVPEHNVFQTVTKKKVVTNKKVAKVIKAQQTIEQIEEMKKDELLQGNNAALYQHLLRSGGNEAPILQKLGIESLAEKYSAKIREQDKRSSRHHHRRRDESRRGHKYRRRSHSKSRSRSRSTEKPKMRALEVKSWKDFVKGGFHFDRFRRFKMDEAEEIKDKERKSRKKKRHGDSRADTKNHKNESNILSETEKGTGDQKLRHNLLDRKKEILKGLEVNTHEGDFTKDFPSYLIRCTKNKPSIKFSENPANATYHLQNRQQMLATLLPEIEAIVLKFLSAMKPKKLKENCYTDNNYNNIDEKLLVMMKDKNIYPFKGWWPKTNFIITQVKEDPNVEIDEDVLMNEITTSKRTKKSRFNDDTSLVELRPTVPSKWDSDYDGSPAAENKVAYVGVNQSVEINTNDNICTIKREENHPLDISHQEEEMDTASDVAEDEPKIEVNVCPALPVQIQEAQGHNTLNTEYEEFLKIVKVDKEESDISITTPATNITSQKDYENNLSIKSSSLNNDSIQDDESDGYVSTKSSVEYVSLQNAAEESDSNDGSFIEELPTVDMKFRKKKKSSSKKSKSLKNRESKKKRYKSSSSESSQDSESESDSSSDDSDSESTDSTSTIEKKRKKKSKNKKKRKTKSNYKKKHRGDKNKTNSPEDEKDANSSILNLIEKALNVEIKKRPSDSKEPKQKKKKRKHEKNKNISNEENDEKFEKVKDCLKETITKLVKTEKVNKNQSLSCDDTVIEVLKYLNDKEKKNKKSKKSLKRKHDSDISDDEEMPKKSKLIDSCSKPKVNEKKKKSKKKKSIDSDEYMTKKKSKRKSKTTDTSEADDVEVLNQNKIKNDSVQFFELRPNEWNINKKSSRRGVVHHSEVKNKTSPVHDNKKHNENIKQKKSDSLNSIDKYSLTNRSKNKCEVSKLPDVFKEHVVEKEKEIQLLKPNKNIKSDKIDNVSKSIVDEEKILINFTNSNNEPNEEVVKCIEENDEMSNKSADKCSNDICQLKNDLQQSIFLKNDNSEQHNTDKDLKSNFKPQTQSTPPNDPYDKLPIICTTIKAATETISYRDKVKMNLKKLSSCQNIPFAFGFSSPISLIKSNNFKFDKSQDLKETKKENESNKDDPTINETQLLESDKPKVINFPPIHIKIPNVTKKELLKNNIETNEKTLDHSYDWDNSEESDIDQSLITSTNSSDEGENEQISSNLLKNYSPNISNKNETFSKNSEFKELDELTSHMLETNNSSESVIKEKELPLEVDNFFIEKEITTLSNCTDFSKQNLDCNTEELQNDVISVKMDKKNSYPLNSQKSGIDIIEVSKSNNELINQWTSDWINLDKSVTEINHSSQSKSGEEELKLKKKSRWDKQPADNKISKLERLNNGQEEYKDETETNNLIDELKDTNTPTNNEDDLFNEQNQTCEIMSINCTNDYNETNPYVFDDYPQTYEQYSSLPMYSEMKTIDHDLLSPIDYSVYENFNPHYNYHSEDYEMWNYVDTDTSEHEMIKAIPTTDETVSQLIDVSENVPSDNISVDQVICSQEEVPNENVDTIISDTQEIVKNEKSDSASQDELFVKLYHQHFQHYNQNPIKYSLSDPVIINTDDVKVNIPDNLTSQERLSETDQKSDDIMSIPLQTRAYVCILEDDNTNLYLTSDNYMAYCAVEDRCMVHISVNACRRDGVGNDVRHCFNVNLNGSINEYWLHADLIPFHVPSDAESGVFSDDEMDSLDSDSVHEDDVDNDNNENDDHIIESEWEIVDNIHDNVNSWLDEPYILKKYNITHDDSHINEEHYVTSSSECDTDGSEFSDSYVEMFNYKQNINENHLQTSLETKDDEHKYQNVINVETLTNVSENTENSDLLVETEECIKSSEQLVLDVEIKNGLDTLEVNENNLTLKIDSKNNDVLEALAEKVNNDNASVMSEEKENNRNESGLNMKEEVTVVDLSMMNTIINQKLLIQRLKVRAKEKVHEKLPDTIMIRYSDNMETIKHPFLGLFQPPTNSILSKPRSTKPTSTSNLSKRVTFADGIHPGDNLAASPTHDDVGRPLSPPPLKRLMRETLKFKRNMYPFKKTKVRTKLTMVKKKVAKVTPSIKETNPSVIEYYISRRRRLADFPTEEISNTTVLSSDHLSNNNSERTEKMSTPPRPTREVTPVPSDTECWNDEDTIKNNRL